MTITLQSLYRNVLLPPVRRLTSDDAETAHNWFVRAMTFASSHPRLLRGKPIAHPLLQQTLMDGLEFPNPFGSAAGMDKTGTVFPALVSLTGVGHVEIGGVTLEPQPGNARPRVVRVDKHHLINAMGFPNDGAEAIAHRLSGSRQVPVPLGVQVAKNKTTADADAAYEYGQVIRRFTALPVPRPDYFTINVSSPNTPGLRALQAPEMLTAILDEATSALHEAGYSRRRLLVKLAPDLDESMIDDIVTLILQYDTGGLVLTNTTTQRPVHSKYDDRPGGFSGPALFDRSFELVKYAAARLPVDRVLVGVGGINSAEKAWQMLQYADLVDAYTALVLEGPFLFRSMADEIVSRMKSAGITSLAELRHSNRPQP